MPISIGDQRGISSSNLFKAAAKFDFKILLATQMNDVATMEFQKAFNIDLQKLNTSTGFVNQVVTDIQI